MWEMRMIALAWLCHLRVGEGAVAHRCNFSQTFMVNLFGIQTSGTHTSTQRIPK